MSCNLPIKMELRLLLRIISLLWIISIAFCFDLYPYGDDNRDFSLQRKNDDYSPPLEHKYGLPFNNKKYWKSYINENGLLSFVDPVNKYDGIQPPMPVGPIEDAFGIPQSERIFIAPFWANVDLTNRGYVYYRMETDEDQLQRFNGEIHDFFVDYMDFKAKFLIIATWLDVGFYGESGNSNPRNTFQLILGTDEFQTFSMFNYKRIDWVAGVESEGSPDTGRGGTAAQAGFNYGDGDRATTLPYSRTSNILRWTSESNVDEPGLWLYRISETEVEEGGCKPSGTVRTFPRYTSMMGHDDLFVTGPCFDSDADIWVRFGTEDNPIEFSNCTFLTQNKAWCIVPTFFQTGRIDIAVSINDRASFDYVGKFDVVEIGAVPYGVWRVNPDSESWQVAHREVTIEWDPLMINYTEIRVDLMAYSEVDGVPKWEWAEEITYDAPNTGHFTWIPRPTWEILEHNAVGALRVTRRWKKDDFALWSDIHPLGYMLYDWYQNDQELWATMRCEEWYEQEVTEDEYVLELEPCPCNLSQALADRGRFKPTPECNLETDEFYCYRRSTIVHCVENIVPSPRGSDSVCCYDEFENLVYSGDSEEASFSRKYTKEGIIPYNKQYQVPLLSHWLYDGLPYYFCCVWGNRCEYYQRLRETPDCKEYEPPRTAAIFGDPHIMTFDGIGYTFNGKGEYTLMKTTSDVGTSFTIQGRTEQATNTRGQQVQATVLTAVAMKEEDTDTIHIQHSERTILEVLVNGEVLDLRRQTSLHFDGVYLNMPYEYENGNITRVTVTFEDSLIGVVVNGTADMLICHVFIPEEYKNRVEGLMGSWNDNPDDDLKDSGGSVIRPDSSPQLIYEFGKSWEVKDASERLFHYDAGTNHDYYQDNSFIPAFVAPNTLPGVIREEMEQVCDGNEFCEYDVRMTENVWLGKATKESYDHYWQNRNASVDLVVCEYIPTPINGTKTFFRERNYLVGSQIEFECDDDFVLIGTQYRVCDAYGDWSGDDLENDCIPSPICGGLDPVEHGSIEIKGDNEVLEAYINCDEGYELYGSSKRTCDIQNEEWTGKLYTGCYDRLAPEKLAGAIAGSILGAILIIVVVIILVVCRLNDDEDKERDDHYNDYGYGMKGRSGPQDVEFEMSPRGKETEA